LDLCVCVCMMVCAECDKHERNDEILDVCVCVYDGLC
jgi:hypothetical protein